MKLLLIVYAAIHLPTFLSSTLSFGSTDALMIINVQNKFLPDRQIPSKPNYVIPFSEKTSDNFSIKSGSLKIADGDSIIPIINNWINIFKSQDAKIFASLDWHPLDHCFNSTDDFAFELGPKKCVFDECPASAFTHCLDQIAKSDWNQNSLSQLPSHCLQQSFGARFAPSLNIPKDAIIVKNGFYYRGDYHSCCTYGSFQSVQSYPFDTEDNAADLKSSKNFKSLLETHNISRLWITGLATDYCVFQTALDSLAESKPLSLENVIVLESAVRGVVPEFTVIAKKSMLAAGVILMDANYTDPIETLNALTAQSKIQPTMNPKIAEPIDVRQSLSWGSCFRNGTIIEIYPSAPFWMCSFFVCFCCCIVHSLKCWCEVCLEHCGDGSCCIDSGFMIL